MTTTTETFGQEAPQRHLRVLSDRGDTRILLDGVDVSQGVFGVHLNLNAADRIPHAVLELSQASTISSEFDGLARVALGEAPDPGPAAAAFLEAIDAEKLEEAALARVHEFENPNALTKALLAQLVEWANGRP